MNATKRINVVAIHRSALPTYAYAIEGWATAAKKALGWFEDDFYNAPTDPIVMVFLSDGTEPVEYNRAELAEIAQAVRP